MGTIFRSEWMSLCQVFLQTDSAYACVAELGELGLAQFRDLNGDANNYQRKFVNEIRRCDEMERKLRFIEEEVVKDSLEVDDANMYIKAPQPKEMTELEANLEKVEEELISINANTKVLQKNFTQLMEMRAVIESVKVLLDSGSRMHAAQSISEAARGEAGPIQVGITPNFDQYDKENRESTELKFVTGVIQRSKGATFERFLWRMCRGKVFVRMMDISIPNVTGLAEVPTEKAVFILFFSGEALRSRVKRICQGFHAEIYNCPDNVVERASLLVQINTQVEDMQSVLNKTLEHRRRVVLASGMNVKLWSFKVLKIKSIFHTLNMFSIDVTQKCLIAECWMPTADMSMVMDALRRGTEMSGSTVMPVLNEMETHETPPTYFKLNKFTLGFQNIVDAYGIANYREVNPAPWTIISFPFLFACMFGDAGHGIVMFLTALLFLIFEKKIIAAKIKDEIFNTFFGGRYVIILMGAFSIYTGTLYNDFYSKSVNIFGSKWTNPINYTDLAVWEVRGATQDQDLDFTFSPNPAFDHDSGPYPWGVDPVWNLAKNKLNFLNPMKMKMSICIGISQMFFGVMLSLLNHVYNRSWLDVIFVFIPQMLFLCCIFVYLCIQVIIKWLFFYVDGKFIFGNWYPGSNCAPSLLIGLISMFMMKSRDDGFVKGNVPNYDDETQQFDQCYLQLWYPGQAMAEQILLAVAVLSIPVMLLVKPIYQLMQHKRGVPISGGHGHGEDDTGEFNFGDVMVYQAIHTIEFALGCVSHTASYLRLWALSLAHAQLSEVLWDMLFHMGLTFSTGYLGAVMIFIFFSIFAVLSVSILILMEGLSAFLHALRLHWVEFQSKFYGGTGIAFEPFSFIKLIRLAEGLDQ
ncbi:unnamed protein product, partial [Mesorhabditis belari]|uniref:V-type proton ATPase subunit a n=1 Tax=Mesorhabditis belari TaxID=2138241 RepID=A0AAF3EWQ9_9BILA